MLKDKDIYHILVVEDNPGDALLIKEFLEDCFANPSMHHVENYKAAELALKDKGNDYHIILLDLSLPDQSGEQLVLQMLEGAKDVPVVALTGSSNINFSIKALQMGVTDYILKDELSPLILYKTIIHNIERRKFYLSLCSSEKRYNDLFHLSPQPMWVYDVETLKFLDVNEAAIRHYGYSEEEFLSMDLYQIRPREEYDTLKENIDVIRDTRRSYGYGVYTHQKKDGSKISVQIHGNEMDYDGKYARIVTTNDITESLKSSMAIQKQNDLLREIAWMQSHLLRAPLTRMLGLIDVIKESTVNDDEVQFCHQEIENSALELDAIIKQIAEKAVISQEIDIR